MGIPHLHEELQDSVERVVVHTKYGDVIGGRASTGAAVFLEIPYALPPKRFQDPQPLPPGHKYEKKEFLNESAFATQPTNDGQAQGGMFEDKVGRGQPTENPLFLNIVAPPSFPAEHGFPVKIYIHGGFLQFGSPHSLSSQAQFIAAQRKEVWVNIGYRVSAFGFLACDAPRLDGNYGFKDQWLGLKWVEENIAAFGGNPNDVQLTGLSAGAHSVHHHLHHVSLLPEGEMAPFQTAVLQSNAILTDPKTPAQSRPQFQALCRGLGLNPDDPNVLDTLRDPKRVPWQSITRLIEIDSLGPLGEYGTFRGCLSDDWIVTSPGPMASQRSGAFSSALKTHGVKAIAIGELTEEWYLYSIAHPVSHIREILPNLNRYFPEDVSRKLLTKFKSPSEDAKEEEVLRLFGEVLSEGQVYLPTRILVRDLLKHRFPVLRYQVRWTPEEVRPLGMKLLTLFNLYTKRLTVLIESYVTHGTDRYLWALRKPNLNPEQFDTANQWVETFHQEMSVMIQVGNRYNHRQFLTLKEDKSIGWTSDGRWDELLSMADVLPGEGPGIGYRL